MTLIDLSHPITDKLPVWDGDPIVNLQQVAFHRPDGFSNFQLECGMHTATHIDGPKHFVEDSPLLSALAIDSFWGEGYLIDTTKYDTNHIINQLQQIDLTQKIVVVYTGYAHKFGTPEYYHNYPTLDQHIALEIAKQHPKMIAFDTPSPDSSPYCLHQLFLSNQILIAENLTNLEPLLMFKRFEIIALPLKTVSDSAPARIIARILQ